MRPDHMKLLKKAQGLDRAQKPQEAAAAYRAFLALAPKHGEGWAAFAAKLLELGELQEAQEACQSALALEPHKIATRINLGCILMRRDLWNDAADQFRSILADDPRRMGVQLFLAECLLHMRDFVGFQKVLAVTNRPGVMTGRYAALQPHHAELWALYGSALVEAQRFEEAEDVGSTALLIDPLNFRAKANLGSVRMAVGALEEAEGLFRKLLAEHPRDEKARLLLITCLARRGDSANTIHEAALAVQQAPASFLVHKSVMGPYYSLGCWTEYRAEVERFRKLAPGLAYLDYEESFVDLLFGEMSLGWERFEARLKVPKELRPHRTFEQPTWTGESFAGKRLLVWAEQGLGDTFMFVRYLHLVKALGGEVILEAQPILLDVVATCRGVDWLVPAGTPLPAFDLQVSLMSLPRVFRTDLSNLPAEVPYLRAPGNAPRRAEIQELLTRGEGSTRIGLVWAGNPSHARDVERSLPVAILAPLAALSSVAWYSFQLGQQEDPPLPGLISLAPYLSDFSDTAYALSGMDLLITVDTSVAHLAGAMGIPTFLLLTHQPDYRWLLNRDDSPWYPTMRLYRQPAFGDWASVIQGMVSDLTQDV